MFISVFCEKTVPAKKVVCRDIQLIRNTNEFLKIRVTPFTFIVSICAESYSN